MIFTAGNLLPPQVIIVAAVPALPAPAVPGPLSDNGCCTTSTSGIILIHVVFQTGFCVFVLSNYMKTLSRELTEAALVDGASVWRIYRSIILPLCRPALAALATLEFTFIYNDFFWALLLMKTGDKRPITSALNNLQGQFFTNNNLLAAAALLVAIPTIIVYLAAPAAVRLRPDARLDQGLGRPDRCESSSPGAAARAVAGSFENSANTVTTS